MSTRLYINKRLNYLPYYGKFGIFFRFFFFPFAVFQIALVQFDLH